MQPPPPTPVPPGTVEHPALNIIYMFALQTGFQHTSSSPAHSPQSASPCTKTGLTLRAFNLDAKITVPPHIERMCPWLLVLALLCWPVIHSNTTLPLRLAPPPCPCEVRTDSEVPKSRSSELAQLSTSRKARPGAVPAFALQ